MAGSRSRPADIRLPLYVSARDFPGVLRAAADLGADVGRVTNVASRVVVDSAPRGAQAVIVGTLGKSPLIDQLVRDGKHRRAPHCAANGRRSSARSSTSRCPASIARS